MGRKSTLGEPPSFHLLLELLRDSSCFSQERSRRHLVTRVMGGFSSGILGLCSSGRTVRSDSLISTSYLLIFPCLVGILFVNKVLGFFHFHLLVFISYSWKGIVGTV